MLHMLKPDTVYTEPQQEVRDTLVMAEPQPPTQHALLNLLCSFSQPVNAGSRGSAVI